MAWPRAVGPHGWIVLTRDDRSRHRFHEMTALIQAGVGRQCPGRSFHESCRASVGPSNTQQAPNGLPYPSLDLLSLHGISRLIKESLIYKILIYLKLKINFYILTSSFFLNRSRHFHPRTHRDAICLCAIVVCMDDSLVLPSNAGCHFQWTKCRKSTRTPHCCVRPIPRPSL
jgi:hypothetical protein